MKVIIITQRDIEYGQPIFIGVVKDYDTALKVCNKDYGIVGNRSNNYYLEFNENKTQVLERNISWPENCANTVYDLNEYEV